jgi:hypothetical protein
MLIVSIKFRYLRLKIVGILCHDAPEKTIGARKNCAGKTVVTKLLKTAIFCLSGSQILG